jgi:transposase
MDRDLSTLKQGYSSKSYIMALRKGLLPHWRHSQVFMQDNAHIHTLRTAMAFLRSHGITPITWPPYLPDLNPIDHLWWHLKKRMHRFFPQYNNFSVAQEEWNSFCEALKSAGMLYLAASYASLS